MAIATYGDLKTAVANWLERSDLTAVIPDFISLARAKAFRGDVGEPLRVNAMVASTSITITAGVGSLPARWLEFLSLRWTGQDGPQLRFVPAQSFWSYAAAYEDVSTPQYYTVEGQNIRLQTTGTTTVNAVYYAAFADLVADSDTDWVLTNAPQLWLHGALAEAASYIGDDARQAREAGLFANAIGALNRSDRRARNSGAVLQSIPATVI